MRIVCPMCGFTREMDEAKIPPRAQMATCPKCQHKFRFRVVDDLEPEPAREDAPTAIAEGGLMSAQRAAAAEAWKRLQGVKPEGRKAGDATRNGAEENAETRKPDADAPKGDSHNVSLQVGDLRENGRGHEAREGGASEEKGGDDAGGGVPFEELTRFGFFPGLFATIRRVLLSPGAFFRAMPRRGGMAKPLAFNLLLSEFAVLCQYVWGITGVGAMSQYSGSSQVMDMGVNMATASPLLLFVFYPLLLVLRLMVLTAVIHLLLKLVRSASGGAEGTFRVLCYSAAPLVCGIVPFFGPLVGSLWSVGVTVIGLKQVHRTNFSASLFAVLVPIMLLLAAVIGILQGAMKAV